VTRRTTTNTAQCTSLTKTSRSAVMRRSWRKGARFKDLLPIETHSKEDKSKWDSAEN